MSEAFSIKMDEMGVKVVSNIMVRKNINVACISSGKIIEPTYQTVQVGIKTHLLENTLLAMNHSCDPNVYIDAKKHAELFRTYFWCVNNKRTSNAQITQIQ